MGQMKRGIIIDGRGSQVRVQFDDSDGVISPWLDVAQSSTIGKKSFTRFKKGEMVRCYLDDKGTTGEALYAIYNDENPAIADSDDVVQGVFPDGSSYIWEPGRLFVDHASGISATFAGGKAVFNGNVEITGTLKVSGDVTVEGSTDLKATKINGVPQKGD